ncbi:M20/M25/M40 family metallo-hydrolase [Haloterrigena salinisoli]|uniref:M20/M25/M40 family metallo-hydrolase n=1 Tax=Haloterrigena salinisoli TaxID=3132747 RepID=UPI0030CB0764
MLFFEGMSVEPGHPFVEAVVNAADSVGIDSEPVGFNAASDARYLRRLDIPTVLFGPGNIEDDVHTVDESINVDNLISRPKRTKTSSTER